MKYAVSIWNFAATNRSVCQAIRLFARGGFDCVSLKPQNVLDCNQPELAELNATLDDLNLPVTVHGDLGMSIDEVQTMLLRLKGRLVCLSLDPRCRIDPDGVFFSVERHVPLLEWLVDTHSGFGIEFCIEDFPLNERALKRNRSALRRVLSCPAFGILVDLGHMNLRTASESHFVGLSYSEYLSSVPVPIKELHIHDNTSNGDKHMPLGHGDIDFRKVIMGLKHQDFDGYCTVEVAPRLYGRKAQEEVDNVIASMREFKALWSSSPRA